MTRIFLYLFLYTSCHKIRIAEIIKLLDFFRRRVFPLIVVYTKYVNEAERGRIAWLSLYKYIIKIVIRWLSVSEVSSLAKTAIQFFLLISIVSGDPGNSQAGILFSIPSYFVRDDINTLCTVTNLRFIINGKYARNSVHPKSELN